ncbi:MAG TPA: MotA/TolQ/ExbB proton channel family protein [Myxococcota bacterium]|nr:MotA/TolQ/ExbB proton channel family protein [Myxococcota bacterium]
MLDYILGSSPIVSAVLLILILASVSSWAIMIMKFREFRAAERDTEDFVEAYLESPLENAYEVARKHPSSPLATVFRAGYTELARLEKLQAGSNRVTRDQVEGVISRLGWIRGEEVHRLERGLSFLATIASSGPFVGLFGTVVGIMNSFQQIGAMQSASLAVVAPGIAEALVATAFGLAAAIPAAVGYNYTSARLNRLAARLETFGAEFAEVLRRTAHRAA